MTYSVPQDMSSQGVPEVAQERSFEEQVGGHLARLDAERTAPVEKPADDASVLTFPMLLDIYSGWVSRSAMALVDPKRGGLAVVVGASDNADNVRNEILRRFEEQSGGAAALRADVKYDDGFFYLHQDQLDALHALLSLVHYDDLAESWLKMLPVELRPQGRGEQQ